MTPNPYEHHEETKESVQKAKSQRWSVAFAVLAFVAAVVSVIAPRFYSLKPDDLDPAPHVATRQFGFPYSFSVSLGGVDAYAPGVFAVFNNYEVRLVKAVVHVETLTDKQRAQLAEQFKSFPDLKHHICLVVNTHIKRAASRMSYSDTNTLFDEAFPGINKELVRIGIRAYQFGITGVEMTEQQKEHQLYQLLLKEQLDDAANRPPASQPK